MEIIPLLGINDTPRHGETDLRTQSTSPTDAWPRWYGGRRSLHKARRWECLIFVLVSKGNRSPYGPHWWWLLYHLLGKRNPIKGHTKNRKPCPRELQYNISGSKTRIDRNKSKCELASFNLDRTRLRVPCDNLTSGFWWVARGGCEAAWCTLSSTPMSKRMWKRDFEIEIKDPRRTCTNNIKTLSFPKEHQSFCLSNSKAGDHWTVLFCLWL